MTVYIAPRKGYDRYHTDRDCVSLSQANWVDDKDLSEVDGLEECAFCTGEFDRVSNPREGLRAKIERGEVDID